MGNSSRPEIKRQINNLCAKIKSRYPHLYEETGGKYIRKTLRNLLESDDMLHRSEAAYCKDRARTTYKTSTPKEFVHAAVIRPNKASQQRAA